ncbi:cupin domain-containing protein [Chloroflexi bacterium TSY]|nr:cupin domain-containing protein [Chloroflexi bacterium TSY]
MSELPVYDFRTDIKNLLVTPQIRARFLKMAVGQFNQGHTHDLGHEIFLILQGQAEFNIDGKKATLGPGQLCVALTDEWHSVENVGDEEVIMYLSVTPHVQPTHTMWNEDGTKKPPRFVVNTAYDVEPDRTTPTAEILDKCLAASETFAQAAQAHSETMREQAEAAKAASSQGNQEAVNQARNAMWDALSNVYSTLAEFSDAWNEFGSRTVDEEYSRS